jgi:queuine tRNA-ribosyltransferase
MTRTMTKPFSFRLLRTDGAARRGELITPHGAVQTPAFMPVGTQATVKGLMPDDVRSTGAEIVLGNTYHLMLRPGAERIAGLGGLHKFMNWPLPILTDSGGFQVMSLSDLRQVDERGVTFRSHLDGAMVALSPERAIEIQGLLGADIAMQLDECLKLPTSSEEIVRAMQLSLRWAERSRRAFEGHALRCAQRARASSPAWISRAMPSAGSRWASRRRSCSRSSPRRRRHCPRNVRAT